MAYQLFLHRHNFAVWAAARATQRGFTNTTVLQAALETAGISRHIQDPSFLDTAAEQFAGLHRSWCRGIITELERLNVQNVTYGRAAKLVAIYLKAMVITSNDAYSVVGHAVHPPIDRRLLRSLSASSLGDKNQRSLWRQTNWTFLDETAYGVLISGLRSVISASLPFWTIEEYWTPADE